VLLAFVIALGAIGFVSADSVVGPVLHPPASVSPTSDITEDPSPIITVWKRLQSRTHFAAGADLTEDPSPTFWKKLRSDTRPTVDVVTEDPTPTNTIWKKLHSPGVFQSDLSNPIASDPIEVMYFFCFIENDSPQLLLIAEPR
jgi:hypothetical protein